MTATIRRASDSDAEFIAWTILAAQRGHRPRGWFDIALDRPEPECLAFTRELARAPSRSDRSVRNNLPEASKKYNVLNSDQSRVSEMKSLI